MEAIKRFIRGSGCGCGDGSGYGSGSGCGYGSGCGSGCGDGYGYGYGDGSGYGSGYDCGDGSGYSSGYGYGYGYGSGSGCGDGYGSGCGDGYGDGGNLGIKMFNGITVYAIDNTPTLIYRAHGNNAQGAILNGDLTLTPCAVVKSNNTYAHGKSLRAAYAALADKLFTDMPDDKRIAAFLAEIEPGKTYPTRLFFDWHHRLTGSCETGRLAFAREHDIDLENGAMTVEEFVQLTGNAYGGDIIRRVAKHYTHTANSVKGGR